MNKKLQEMLNILDKNNEILDNEIRLNQELINKLKTN